MNTQAVLEQRARALAVPLSLDESAFAEEFLCFEIGGTRYAIESTSVVRVERILSIAPIPGVPAYVIGVVRLSGEVVPLFDLPALLDAVPSATAIWTRALLIGRERAEFAIAVDVTDALEARALGVYDASLARGACVRGVLADARIVLNGAALIADPRLAFDGASTTPELPRGLP